MALDSSLQSQIVQLTNDYWTNHASDSGFSELIRGKEPGHRMADYVDDRTAALLKVNLDTRYEGDRKGGIKKRSMGDIWVRSNGMFNPINVKAGLQDMNGQPNVVSMQKLLDYLFKRYIDSYYLLIVKFSVEDGISHRAYLIDLLDWLDYITYDAGPGQIMLREKDFYAVADSRPRGASLTVPQKADKLFSLFERQLRSMIANRENRLGRQKKQFREFVREPFIVDQSEMRFVP